MKFKTVNPATEDVIAEYETMSKPEVEERVSNAKKAFGMWREVDIKERSRLVKKLGKRILAKKQQFAETITQEMGKPIKESIPEAEKCALLCGYFGKNAEGMLKDEKIKTEYKKSYVTFEPLGIIGSIMPWNFPMWQALRFAIPSIIAGNVQVTKPSSTTPNSGGMMLEGLFEDCKFPEHVFQAVIGDATTGTALVESKISAVSLTGSVEAGSKVAQLAMKDIKKVILELGGSDPFVVLSDADVEKAVTAAVAGRFLNCGQSCIAAKRFIVLKDVADAFTEKFIEKTKQLKAGDPMEPETDIGPLVREEQRAKVEAQVSRSLGQGAKILLGGKRLEKKGYFFEPTIMMTTNDTPVAREEAFGPVAPIIIAENEQDAIKIANDTEYGLGASIWTNDLERGEQLTKKIQAGLVYVNKTVRSDPRMPFGGVKKSGIGRELSRYGLLEMVNIKSVIINE